MTANLPPQVQAQLEQAEQLLAEQNQAIAAASTPTPIEPTAPEESVAAPEAQPVSAPAPAPAPAENWEQKYRSLQGVFNSQIGKLRQEVQTLGQQNQNLLSEIERARRPEPKPAAPADDNKDVEVFGQDLVDMVQRTVDRVVGSRVSRAEQVLAQIQEALAGTQKTVTQSVEQQFYTRVMNEVPDFATVNNSAEFSEWLQVVDPVYGLPRKAALDDAANRYDADQAVRVFKAFLASHQPPKTPPVESQVVPRTVGSQAPSPAPAKPVFTQRQVQVFYDDERRGAYRGREQERARIEAEINLAMAEGRIR
jgi:hypothetical protein